MPGVHDISGVPGVHELPRVPGVLLDCCATFGYILRPFQRLSEDFERNMLE